MTRQEALAAGAIFYVPVKACKRCSTSKRYAKTGQCVACHARWSCEYADANREKIKQDNRRRWATDSKRKERQRAWQAANRDKCRQASKNWERKNPESGVVRVGIRRALKKQACPAWVNRKALQEIYREARDLTSRTGRRYHVDHIVPLNNPGVCGLHVPWNLQILLAEDNIRKANRLYE